MSYYFEKNLASFRRFEGFPEGLLTYFVGRDYEFNHAHLPENHAHSMVRFLRQIFNLKQNICWQEEITNCHPPRKYHVPEVFRLFVNIRQKEALPFKSRSNKL